MSAHRMAYPLAIAEIRAVILLTLAAILAGCETAQVSDHGFLITHDDAIKVRPETRALQLRLPNGNSLEFLARRDERGELYAHGLVEYRRAKNRGIASVPGLPTASIPEIYYALAEPNAETPEPLRLDRYPDPTRPQGWARDIILTGGPTGGEGTGDDISCSETNPAWVAFRQEVVDQGYALVFLSAGDGPVSKPNHWATIETDWMSPDGHELRGGVADATALYVSVLRCAGDTPPWSSWPSPLFRVFSRDSGAEGYFDTELEEYLPEAGDQATYIAPETTIGDELDYRVTLRHYENGSKFHFGAAWQKPADTLSPIP